MILCIKQDKEYKNPVKAIDIHGKYPYKLYFELKGSSEIGKYIAVISHKPLKLDKSIESVLIQLVDKVSVLERKSVIDGLINDSSEYKGARPNMVNDKFIRYYVKEKSIMDVKDINLKVFQPVE